MKVIFTDQDKKRMDRFDAVIHEYLRANRKTVDYLCNKIGCSQTSLWRYSSKVECFSSAPLDVVAGVFRMANVSNEDLRYILGLPYGKEK